MTAMKEPLWGGSYNSYAGLLLQMPARFIDSDAVHCLLLFDRRGLLSVRGSLFFFLTPAYILYPVLLYYYFFPSLPSFAGGGWLCLGKGIRKN